MEMNEVLLTEKKTTHDACWYVTEFQDDKPGYDA
jgi:hypothetical protein